ncbi:alpha-mannosidase [Elysia marginata]|uniref:Alpha-mannosidase n=1 Tax=Elysia marginata TaxID=1093978 RepID=A0AAV4IGJ5_9GAST|nr:alpha-mannosidase [Elysia marginata]
MSGTAGRNSVLPRLTVILMPHSHNDPGWLKTVNEYYADQTKHILNNMVNKLTEYPNMTFIWAETVFFSMWWNELDDAVKMHVQRLARRGQLEFVSGGWVMPDEAVTHFGAVVDQLMEGHQWLWNNLGIRTENVWSIDPFGLSGTLPYLWRLSGMRNMVIQRVHQSVKAALSERQALEFYWRQSWDSSNWGANDARHVGRDLFGVKNLNLRYEEESDALAKVEQPKRVAAGGLASTDILCHVMPFLLYSIPYSCGPQRHVCEKFDFGIARNDRFVPEKFVEDITSNTVAANAQALAMQYRAKASFFQFNVILVPIGDDFRYEKEFEWDRQYSNYEKLMHYMNNRQDWNLDVRWGTLRDYFKLVRLQEKKKLSNGSGKQPVLSGDFFPYSDKDRMYWTGYYTTRPFDKYFCRDVQFLLNAADQLNTLNYALYLKWGQVKGAESKFFHLSSMLQQARQALALFQHHDAITGTSKDFVAEDYEEYLLNAYKHAQDVIRQAIQCLLTESRVETPVVFHPVVERANHQDIPRRKVLSVSSSGRGTIVTFYNPLGQVRSEVVSLLVDSPAIQIISSQAKEVLTFQVSPVWSTSNERAMVEDSIFEVSFELSILPFSLVTVILSKLSGNGPPPLGGNTFFSRISVYNEAFLIVPPSLPFIQAPPRPKWHEDILVSNGLVELAIDPKTGSLIRITHFKSGHTTHLGSSFQYYTSKKSGAYIFSPAGKAEPLFRTSQKVVGGKPSKPLFSNIPTIRVLKGEFATFIDIAFHSSISQRITLYSQPSHLAGAIFIENILSIQNLIDKEIVLRFNTDIRNTDLSYFTDQNGFQFIRRRTLLDQPIEANYYPMTSGIILEDTKTRLTVLTAQSHGCACLKQGQLEIMLDRQLTTDDFRGLGEGIADIKTTISRFAIFTEALIMGKQEQQHSSPPPPPSLSALLSLPALVIQDALNQPILAYFSTVDSDVFFHSLTPVPLTAVPCDVTAVSMRSLVTNSFEYNGTMLVLHQRGYDCSLQPPWMDDSALFCAPSDIQLTMDSIFGDFSYSKLRETSLTATVVKRSMTPKDHLLLKPMELSAFHFFF